MQQFPREIVADNEATGLKEESDYEYEYDSEAPATENNKTNLSVKDDQLNLSASGDKVIEISMKAPKNLPQPPPP